MISTTMKKGLKTYSRKDRIVSSYNQEPSYKNGAADAVPQPSAGSLSPIPRTASSRVTSSGPSPDGRPFSSESELPQSSPPSSPPPAQSPILEVKRRAFKTVKRKRDDLAASSSNPKPLCERSDNIIMRAPSKKKQRLTQMKIDLGGEVRKMCGGCGMNYIPSDQEDAALHKKFHAINAGGVDLPKAFVSYVGANKLWSGEGGSFVVALDRKDSLAARNVARKALDVVNAELSAVGIGNEQLWSQMEVDDTDRGRKKIRLVGSFTPINEPPVKSLLCDRFKVYLYVRGGKCVGLCLAERITVASRVIEAGDAAQMQRKADASISSSISVSDHREPAILGISRIWTSSIHRKGGIARVLLDCAADTFVYGIRVNKELVAFSQPTESGGLLARRWFGEEYGWHVYSA